MIFHGSTNSCWRLYPNWKSFEAFVFEYKYLLFKNTYFTREFLISQSNTAENINETCGYKKKKIRVYPSLNCIRLYSLVRNTDQVVVGFKTQMFRSIQIVSFTAAAF